MKCSELTVICLLSRTRFRCLFCEDTPPSFAFQMDIYLNGSEFNEAKSYLRTLFITLKNEYIFMLIFIYGMFTNL